MGFTQLLVANRGLRNIKDGPSRYKMTQANLLPKFGADKDAREAKVESMAEVAAAGGAPTVEAGMAAQSALVSRPGLPVKMEPTAPKPVRRAGWIRFGNPFGGESRPARPSAPVQTELLLDAVKPVRNRLGENEFEPARIPSAAVSATVPALVAAPVRPADAPGFVRRWTARLFRVGRKT